MAFRIERNDITKVHTEAIVNTANPLPVIGTGTDAAVYTAAGADFLLEARKKIGKINPGETAFTNAYRLFDTNGIRYIIHTVGIKWQGGKKGETEVIRNCYRNSLKIAKELNCKSISIPLLAAGNYGFPKETALNIALDEISRFLFENEMEVVLVVYDRESFRVSNKIFDGVQSYINENYIGEKRNINNGSEIMEYLLDYDSEQISEEELRSNQGQLLCESEIEIEAAASPVTVTTVTIEDFLTQNKSKLNFQELLKKHIDDKGLDNPTVYKRSIIIDKKLFSKIINGHIPNKHSVMALGLALELNLEEYQLFLATANFALNPADMFDTVIKYCVTQKIYDVMKVDALLFQLDLPCFNK